MPNPKYHRKIDGHWYVPYTNARMTKDFLSPPCTIWTQFVKRVIEAGGDVLCPAQREGADPDWIIEWNGQHYYLPDLDKVPGWAYERVLNNDA